MAAPPLKQGFDAADRGDYVALNSEEELDAFLDQVHEEASERFPV
jgi:hypothetical protein